MQDQLTLSSAELITRAIESAVILAAALALFFGLKRGLAVLSKSASLPSLTLTPVRILLRYGILILAGCLILSRFGINVNGVFTVFATGLAMVAIGFVAVWSVLSNFLCTFVLIIFKPFSVGDEIEFTMDQVGGKVVDLTLIFTTLRGKEGELYQIPNNMFFQRMFKCRPGNQTVDLNEQFHAPTPTELKK